MQKVEESYKIYHLNLMHSNGTTSYETLLAIFPSYFFTSEAVLLTCCFGAFIKNSKTTHFLFDFCTVIVPCILSFTSLSEYLEVVLISLATVLLTTVVMIHNGKFYKVSKETVTGTDFAQTSFITNARATINVLSVIAILAVDFSIFPRRYAKTEKFGFSLMDTGVGLYIFSNGIVAPETRGKSDSIRKSLKGSLPLFLLGGFRFFFTKQVDYNVPVSEYGVHWNFFITLAVTKLFSSLILNIFRISYIYANAVMLIVSHEVFLQAGLQNFVLRNRTRDNFISANREGIVSSLGYVSLYLFSVYFGHVLNLTNRNTSKGLKQCVIGSLLALTFSWVFQHYFGISRMLANAAYCFWILFIGIFMTGLYLLMQNVQEVIFSPKSRYCFHSPLIFEAVNYNGLVFFLVGNILTGVINLSFDTLRINNFVGIGILIVYMLINCSVVSILYGKQLKLKL